MKTMGQMMLRSLSCVAILLCVWSSAVFAAGAATPELQVKADNVRAQMEQRVSNAERQAAADSLKALRQQIYDYKLLYNDPTQRVKGETSGTPQGVLGVDFIAVPTGPFDAAGNPNVPDYNTTANWAFTPPIAKFVDTLPTLSGVDAAGDCLAPNTLGQCLPIAVPDTVTYPGSDYYEISLREWFEVMHSDMPNGTPTRGYIQTNDGTDQTLVGAGCAAGATPSDNSCNTVAPPNRGHFLGPIIIAQRDRPVRIKFTNELPFDADGLPDANGHRDGDLFIPVDESVMGAGAGPSYHTGVRGDVSECNNDDIENNTCEHFSQNRATVHLHGGRTPWISDGTPHQWITPKDENTPYPQGVSVAMVPDMPDPGDGSMTFYYSNQQTARLMFYHDHAFGITRLNVLAGMAAGYVIQDEYEKDLMARQIIPGNEPGEMIPLVMQDRTFVDATPIPNPYNNNVLTPRVRVTDPLWNWGTGGFAADGKTRIPKTGDLWLPHVYMPAQNPFNPDLGGLNPFGRWMYGPWFYPPTQVNHPPIANPYYDVDCSSTNPYILADCQTPGQPPLIPATPHPSMGMEAFFDSWIVNGTAFPTLEVEPKAYRFRILNAANDRALNMSIYKADGTPANMSPVAPGGTTPFSGAAVPANFDPKTEVKLAPAQVTPGWPDRWPIDGRAEMVPDPGDCITGRCSNWGPSWVQIGTDAGFMPKPVVIDPQPIQWNIDPTAFWVGIVEDVALALMPAERADVIVDFSQYANQTLIVYNDAPAAWPAGVFNYDYWTGAPDYRDSGGYGAGGTFNAVTGFYDGGHGPLPGFAPNTRTVMQIKVKGLSEITTPSTLDMAALEAEFTTAAPATTLNPADPTTGATKSLFERAMEPIIVAQSAYDEAYGKIFPSVAPWGGVRYRMDDNHIFNFQTIDGEQVSVLMKPKGIHDEMGASFDAEYGRMSGNLAIELQPPQTNAANLNLYAYSDVPTEIVENSTTAKVQVDVLGQLADGTQIWNISHNGVDTHPIHFHIFDVQLISRLGWDNQIKLPRPNELGWKDTVRISPLMDTIVAVRPVAPLLPFGVPDSVRPLNPALRINSQMGFSNVDPVTGQAYAAPSFWGTPDPNAGGITGVHNVLYNFGWEYVWHCHILSHEEMDMMRAIILQVSTLAADTFTLDATAAPLLSWVDPSPVDYTQYPDYVTGSPGVFGDAQKNEIGFNVWRSSAGGGWTFAGSTLANQTSFDATTGHTAGDAYVIESYNAGNTTYSSALGTVALGLSATPTVPMDLTLTATLAGPIANNPVEMVEYYNGTTLIGTVLGTAGAPYSFTWLGVQSGSYSLTAVVTVTGIDPGNPNPPSLYAVSSPTPLVVGGGLTVGLAATATATGLPTITVCDTIDLVTTIAVGGTAPYTSTWAVDGVTLIDPVTGLPLTGDQTGAQALAALTAGSHQITLTVTDGVGNVGSQTQAITVTNSAPVANAGGPYALAYGGTVALNGTAIDANPCDALSYAWDIDNDGLYDYFSANRTLKYSVIQPWLAAAAATAGPGPVYTLTFKATDASGATSVDTAQLTLGAAPYIITTTALTPGTVGTAYSLQLAIIGANPGSTWQVYGLPDGLVLDPATGIISGTPTAANIRSGSTTATIPVSIINIDATAPAYTSTVLFMTISL
ncbi:MAG TPA: multicopper oxidase domain-containing protein [Geothermobacteraceae bacterium]|nr:multicopper oxidase domain-containing protein [Geothermobacteraceae bacterium]